MRVQRGSLIFLLSLPFVAPPASVVCLWLLFSFFSVPVALGCNNVLTIFWHARGPCHPLAFASFLCQLNGAFPDSATMVKWTRRWKPIWKILGMKATVLANAITLRSPWISTTSTYGTHKPTDNGWKTTCDAPSAPSGLPSTPQSSWQPCSNTNTAQGSWVFRRHILKQPDKPTAVKPMVLGSPDVPAPSKPLVLEIVHPVQYGITPKRQLLPRSDTEILSYIDDDISSIRDGFSVWVKSDPSATLVRHVASKECAKPICREAYERRSFSPQPKYWFDDSVTNRLLEHTRIIIRSWNLGPRRGKPGAIEEHIASKWHTFATQETVEYLQHECLMNHFYITHFAGCAISFNKDTFHSDVQVNSVYIQDTRYGQQQVVMEGQSGWVLQDVISRGIPRYGKPYFAMMSLHINNQYAKKRGIGKNLLLAVRTVVLQEKIDMVAGNFNGAARRRQSGNEQRHNSTTEEALCQHELTDSARPHTSVGTRWCSR